MFKKIFTLLLVLVALTQTSLSLAVVTAGESKMTKEQFVASLKFRHGKIDLPNGIATLNLPDSFSYLDPADAERILVEAWGNPPGDKTLGMIFPSDVSPFSDQSWGVIVSYDEDGHIKDDDADSIKYGELLKDMQEATAADNEDRKKQGYGAMTLVGWAEPPSYDKTTHKFYWAKEFATANESNHSLNYNIRVLGRKGVLVLNAVAGMEQIAQIKREMPAVVGFTNFTAGNGYADFDTKTDKVAEYGLAALVAGGVAAKLGFFGKIFALLLAFKKILLVGIAAFGSAIFKFFKRNKD